MLVHVRQQVLVSRVPTSVITLMQQPNGPELNSDHLCGTIATEAWQSTHLLHFSVIFNTWSVLCVTEDKARPHYVTPESYQVTWWPGDNADEDVRSQAATGQYK